MDFQETFLLLFFHPVVWTSAFFLAVSIIVATLRVLVSSRDRVIVIRDD